MRIHILFSVLIAIMVVASYGFVDSNLVLTTDTTVISIISQLRAHFLEHRLGWSVGYVLLVSLLYFFYFYVLTRKRVVLLPYLLLILPLVFSYSALSYDVFNYVLTAKVSFHYFENPYIIMPIELTGEPMLAFTRAANKIALYGPVWILFSGIPHILSLGNVWLAVVSFKLFAYLWYLSICFFLYKLTRDVRKVALFALNPLVVVETLIGGHNDVIMMALALGGYYFFLQKGSLSRKLIGLTLLCSSVLIKGATIVLIPVLYFLRNNKSRLYVMSFVSLFGVFLLSPLREEMYPWYAIWFLVFTPLLSDSLKVVRKLAIVFTFGLLLRHAPYIAMGYYEGPGPMLRNILMIAPVILYVLWYVIRGRRQFV